jgi:hypothetical protein
MKYLLSTALASLLLLAAPAASAAVVIVSDPDHPNVTTDDGNGPATDTVHLIADGFYNDLFVFGTTGPTNVGVQIEGLENIQPSSDGNGQPWIIDTAGDGLSSLAFSLLGGYNFTSIEFNLNTFKAKGEPVPWTVDVFSYNGGLLEKSTLSGLTNSSFINVFTTNGETLSKVVFNSNGNPNFQGVGQIRISGLVSTTVPEPATWGLMIMGFGGMGAMLRRRRTAFA